MKAQGRKGPGSHEIKKDLKISSERRELACSTQKDMFERQGGGYRMGTDSGAPCSLKAFRTPSFRHIIYFGEKCQHVVFKLREF